ncbi:MAG: hypothetical protein QNK37_34675, partial [Acidobacteriota bacterium]|nr:hypothetical protein [Acidobacteriota bacterium]
MHPEWQQFLVQNLTDCFPNIQFIVTTHSPLLAADLPAERVIRLRRDEDGRVAQLRVTNDMTQGRADQVLTSRLFGLRTTRPELAKKINEYSSLGHKNRTKEEQKRFEALQKELGALIPSPDETNPERKAQELFEAVLEEQAGHAPPKIQQRLRERARALLEEVSNP